MNKFLKHLLITFIVILLVIFSLLCSNIAFKHITLSLINSFVPVKVSVDRWTFHPWKSIHARGLVVADISKKTGITNFYLSVNSLNLNYEAASLLSDLPVFDLVEVQGAVFVSSSSKSPVVKAKKPNSSKKKKKKHSDISRKKTFSLPSFPVIIKKIVVKNFSFKYTEDENLFFGITNFNFAGINIGPKNSGSALANGSAFYNDGNHIIVKSIPFAWEMDYTIRNSVIPDLFSSTLLVSNITGQTESMNLSPLAVELNISTSKTDDFLNISNCLLKDYWNGNNNSSLSITGKVNFIENIINCQANINIWSNNIYQTLIFPQKKYSISHGEGILNFKTKADIYKIYGKLMLEKVYSKKNKDLPFLNFNSTFDLSFNNKINNLKLNGFNFIVENKKHQIAQLKTTLPFSLNLGDKDIIKTNNKSQVSLVINKLDIKYFNNFVSKKNIKFNSGEINSKIICDIVGTGNKINVNSLITADKVNFSFNKSIWDDIGIKLNFDGNINNLKAVSLSHFNTSFFIKKRLAGEIAAGGTYNIQTGKEKIAIAATDISGELISPLIDKKGKNKILNNLFFNLKVLLEQAENITNRKILLGFNINNPKRSSEKEIEKINLDINANITPDKLTFNKCVFSAFPSKWDDNNLKLTGEFNFKKKKKPSDLTLHSKHFDATVLFDTFMPLEKPHSKKRKRRKHRRDSIVKKDKKSKEINEPVPPKDNFINLIFKTHIDEFIVRKMEVTPLSFDFIMENNKINFLTRNVKINGGQFDLNTQIDLNVTGYVYSSTLNTTNIPLYPVLETWSPKISNKVLGNLDSKVLLSGKGFSATNIVKFLKGDVNISLHDGYFENIPLLTELSNILRLKDLNNYNFNKCIINGRISDGTNFIDDINIESKTIKMGIDGYATMNKNVDLDIYLALSGRTIKSIFSNKKFKINVPFTGSLDKFYKLPMPIKVTGQFDKPKIKSNIKNFVPVLLKAVGANAVSIIDGLFGKNKEKKKKAKEEGVELLKGLWNELQKQPMNLPQKKHNLPHRTK